MNQSAFNRMTTLLISKLDLNLRKKLLVYISQRHRHTQLIVQYGGYQFRLVCQAYQL
jgi:hypothetical protein